MEEARRRRRDRGRATIVAVEGRKEGRGGEGRSLSSTEFDSETNSRGFTDVRKADFFDVFLDDRICARVNYRAVRS